MLGRGWKSVSILFCEKIKGDVPLLLDHGA